MVSIGHDGQVIIWDMFAAVKLKVFQIKVSCFVIIITACLLAYSFSFFPCILCLPFFLVFPLPLLFPLSFLQYEEEGVPCIFDCKWSPDGLTCAAADSFGYMTIFGFGSSTPYEQVRQWVWPLRNNKPVILNMILA